jgi:putative transposase of IS4/5 family DUF4096
VARKPGQPLLQVLIFYIARQGVGKGIGPPHYLRPLFSFCGRPAFNGIWLTRVSRRRVRCFLWNRRCRDLLEPMFPPAKLGGRPRDVSVREVLNAICYVLSTGCQWQALPKDLLPKSTAHYCFMLREWKRHAGAHPPRVPLSDARAGWTRSVPKCGDRRQPKRQGCSERGSARDPQGFDAGNKVTGRKRHLLTSRSAGAHNRREVKWQQVITATEAATAPLEVMAAGRQFVNADLVGYFRILYNAAIGVFFTSVNGNVSNASRCSARNTETTTTKSKLLCQLARYGASIKASAGICGAASSR